MEHSIDTSKVCHPLHELVQGLISEGTQQEFPLNGCQQVQQPVKILLGVPVIMTLIRAYIGRIAVEKSASRVPAPNNLERVTALDLGVLEPDGIILCKIDPLVSQLFSGSPGGTVIAETAVKHVAVR